MMEVLREINYEDLPSSLMLEVSKSDFLQGYISSDTRVIIIWVVQRDFNSQFELEFDMSLNRLLTREERKRRIPEPNVVVYPDADVDVVRRFVLDEKTDCTYEVFEIYPRNSRYGPTEVRQLYYSGARLDGSALIKNALGRILFPDIYSGWSIDQKVSYWVSEIYKMRRRNSESGIPKEYVFGKILMERMISIDADIKNILPKILTSLSEIEPCGREYLVSSFNSRVGENVVS